MHKEVFKYFGEVYEMKGFTEVVTGDYIEVKCGLVKIIEKIEFRNKSDNSLRSWSIKGSDGQWYNRFSITRYLRKSNLK